MCDPVRLHPTQACGEPNNQARDLEATEAPQQGVRVGRTDLEDALGSWLNEEMHAETELLEHRVNDAVTGMALYRELWRDSDDAWSEAMERMKTRVETRDIVINMLTHCCLKLLASNPDEQVESRLQPTIDYVMEMRQRALASGDYNCLLMSTEQIRERVDSELVLQTLVDLSTDEDTEDEHEVIDLTYDSEDETEDMEY